jgi:hypothetical protein
MKDRLSGPRAALRDRRGETAAVEWPLQESVPKHLRFDSPDDRSSLVPKEPLVAVYEML